MIVHPLYLLDSHGRVTPVMDPRCAWVADRGIATRMRDGVTMRVLNGRLWRVVVLMLPDPLRPDPEAWEPGDPAHPVTHRRAGWFPISSTDPTDEIWRRATWPTEDGTYEYCGPHLGGNLEALRDYQFFKHGSEILPGVPTDLEGLRVFLSSVRLEGVVWHEVPTESGGELPSIMVGTRMAKVTRAMFGLPWPPERRFVPPRGQWG